MLPLRLKNSVQRSDIKFNYRFWRDMMKDWTQDSHVTLMSRSILHWCVVFPVFRELGIIVCPLYFRDSCDRKYSLLTF